MTVNWKQLQALNRESLVSPYAYSDATDLLVLHSKVRVAVSQQLSRGINALEFGTRMGGVIESFQGAADTMATNIFSNNYRKGLESITRTGMHDAVLVDRYIFDNHTSGSLPLNYFFGMRPGNIQSQGKIVRPPLLMRVEEVGRTHF